MATPLEQTLIVVPAYNEEASVGATVSEILTTLPGVACLVVDDGSTDATSIVAQEAGATVAVLPFNLGVGGAMRFGFKYAISHGFRNVIQIDADGQHDPANVPQLLTALADADLVIGARFAGSGAYEVKGPRKWAMKVLSSTLSRSARTTLTDTTSGFKASGPKAVALFASNYPAEYLGDTIEALVIAMRAGCVITQIPVSMRPRTAGVPSHNPLKAATYLGRVFLALGFALFRPIARPEQQVEA
ncbi:glycosyltransferase family 2 protein [Leifsonia soli]|uniref:Glycosyltransferase involved in cell wall biosynthesis n=1 Tax=Leifsonia soli TaxID=582665 RepID=A0A852SV95_9MICO|nr:glycosyltransferase family 2 protein [Leifsonia soli]NYD72632.1 glycosyltransferase involved in cell wall biosynthesis [Leifsonia soli]